MSEAARREAIAAALGHAFADWALAERALTHASFGDGLGRVQHYERLEFLGDRVLGLMAAERLYAQFREAREGGLAQRLNLLVNKAACAAAARHAGLGALLRLSKAEEAAGGRDKETILADACEAVVAALYLDGGLAAALRFFEAHWTQALSGLATPPRDPKTALQEWAHQAGLGEPAYRHVAREGPDHAPRFRVRVALAAEAAQGEAGSKQEAEREAARALLQALREAGRG